MHSHFVAFRGTFRASNYLRFGKHLLLTMLRRLKELRQYRCGLIWLPVVSNFTVIAFDLSY